MDVLNWMGRNFVLTIILAGIISETLARMFKAGRMKGWRCPSCGHRGAVKGED